ncbi:alpha/beta-hydrolase [Aspergillus recurvatus]
MSPTIVLVPGGWHYPAHYGKFTSALRDLGHEVFVPTLLSMNGARPPNSTVFTDADHIHSFVESLADTGREVIVLMHSYGGQVGTNGLDQLDVQSRRAKNLRGGVVRLIYVCAQALQLGESMYGLVAAAGREQYFLAVMDVNDDGTTMIRNATASLLGPDAGLPEEEMQAYVSGLGLWNGRCLYEGAWKSAWRDIPVTYLKTLRDMALPVSYQSRMVDAIRTAGREVEVIELNSGHSPHVTMTDELAEIVHGIVSRA